MMVYLRDRRNLRAAAHGDDDSGLGDRHALKCNTNEKKRRCEMSTMESGAMNALDNVHG